jgi:hypothetical protein
MKDLIEKIKKNGYWKVIIRPIIFDENKISNLEECKKIIESSVVSLRGWNYPHIDKGGIKISGNDSIESYCDSTWLGYFEYWRFYQSGQFVHYFSMREDYRIDEKEIQRIQRQSATKSTKLLDIISTLYSVTEIFEFAQRLASKDILGNTIEISIELGGVENRELFFWDSFSRWLNNNYICTFRDENILVKRALSKEELITKSSETALSTCMEIFKKFNWSDAPEQVFVGDQKKFLEKRL